MHAGLRSKGRRGTRRLLPPGVPYSDFLAGTWRRAPSLCPWRGHCSLEILGNGRLPGPAAEQGALCCGFTPRFWEASLPQHLMPSYLGIQTKRLPLSLLPLDGTETRQSPPSRLGPPPHTVRGPRPLARLRMRRGWGLVHGRCTPSFPRPPLCRGGHCCIPVRSYKAGL